MHPNTLKKPDNHTTTKLSWLHAIASPIDRGGFDQDNDVRGAMLRAFGISDVLHEGGDASSSALSMLPVDVVKDPVPRTKKEWFALEMQTRRNISKGKRTERSKYEGKRNKKIPM